MVKRLVKGDFWKGEFFWRLALWLAVVAMLTLGPAAAQGSGAFSRHRKGKADEDTPPAKKPFMTASQQAALSIPVEPLGFYAPGAYYQGQRESLVSLDFIDENQLLFTFRAPGLIHRTGSTNEEERHIRALVLALPQGAVEAETLWTLHDHERYLWMLKDGHFLLRDENDLKMGDASLELKPLLHFPGPLLWMEMDPDQQYIVTDSHEPASDANVAAGAGKQPEEANAPAEAGAAEIVLRVLRRSSGQVLLVSRVHNPVYLPINATGYVETEQTNMRQWRLDLNHFAGGTRTVAVLDSACDPRIDFVTQKQLVATACNMDGTRRLVGLGMDGRRQWDAPTAPNQVWPILVMSPEGSRMARETLFVTHPIDAYSPLSFDDVVGQVVEVYDTATGKVVVRVPASPVLDGGGNVAISPSGRRLAVLDAGLIQVYDLTGSGPLPAISVH